MATARASGPADEPPAERSGRSGSVPFDSVSRHIIDELQADLDTWLVEYNYRRPHQGRWCFGKTPMQTFLDALPLAKEKLMAA